MDRAGKVTFRWADTAAPLGEEDTKGISRKTCSAYQNGLAITRPCTDPRCVPPGRTTGTNCGLRSLDGVPGACCDAGANTWTLPLESLSELVVAEDLCDDVRACARPRRMGGSGLEPRPVPPIGFPVTGCGCAPTGESCGNDIFGLCTEGNTVSEPSRWGK